MNSFELWHGDCLELMKNIPDKSVDMILCDLPYGTTNIEWDDQIAFDPLWEQYERITKINAAIVLFSSYPFTIDLILSNRKMFRYEIIWEKTQAGGFLNANKMPLRAHENILVFYKKLPTYNPIKSKVIAKDIDRVRTHKENRSKHYKNIGPNIYAEKGERYPTDVIKFSNWNGALFGKINNATKHPTQKPVDLLEYLIKTYTNEGELVLDNAMGSGSTGVACINTNRKFIGIELNKDYFEIAKDRLSKNERHLLYDYI